MPHPTHLMSSWRLEDAFQRMTSLPATPFGLRERGYLREGSWANLVIIDPATVPDRSTFARPHKDAVSRQIRVNTP